MQDPRDASSSLGTRGRARAGGLSTAGSELSATRLADEERSHHQGNGCQQLHENVERRTGRVLEGVADGVADDAGLVGKGLLPEDVAVLVEKAARLDVLLGVV